MPTPLPSLLHEMPFHVAEARELDIGRGRLRGPDLQVPHHGVRSVAAASTLDERCLELLPVLERRSMFSHVTAAALWGLPVPFDARDGPLRLVSVDGVHTRRPGVIAHRSCVPVSGTILGGLPVVEPATAWAQCAGILALDDLVAMGDALAGRWSPHSSARERPLEDLDAAVTAWDSRRGAKRLREARGLVRSNVWSPKETELRLLIVRAGLPEPLELNAPVTTRGGEVLGHGDLVCRDQRAVIEYEGDGHRANRARWRRDVARYERFQDAGWRVIRVTEDDLVNPGSLLARLETVFAGGIS